MKKMYQVPIDISASRIITPRATQSGLPFWPSHSCRKPYGFSFAVVAPVEAAGGGAAAGAGAGGAAAGAAALLFAGAPGVPWSGVAGVVAPAFGVAGAAVWPAG